MALAIIIVQVGLGFAFSSLRIPGSGDTAQNITVFALATSFFAVLGAVVSVQRRLQDPQVISDPYYQYIQTSADWFGIAVTSPIFGAVFGLIMYGLLQSSLISTKFVMFDGARPKSVGDAAALFVLGFAAGFAEQLIPDAINRIASRALGGVSSGVAPAGPPPPPQPEAKTGPQDGAVSGKGAADGERAVNQPAPQQPSSEDLKMALTISEGTQIENVTYESNAYECIAELGGCTIDVTDPAKILGNSEAGLFLLKVIAAIGAIPLLSDVAMKSLPQGVQPIVQRAHAVQEIRAGQHLNLTPAIALVIAEANDKAGTQGWSPDPAPLGSPVGQAVSNKYWDVQTAAKV